MDGGELEHDEAFLLELVAAPCIALPVAIGRVAEPTADLDDDGVTELEIDPCDRDAALPVNHLAPWSIDPVRSHETEEAPLEVRLAAGVEEQFAQ